VDAEGWIRTLELVAHPEGGYFRETYRDAPAGGARGALTAIYFLLRRGEVSRWHRIDAIEIWHHYDGAALRLRIAEPGRPIVEHLLGKDAQALPHAIVPKHAWQSAATTGDFTLVGCVTSPAFDFAGFELAPPGFEPAS
jgi:predicted cupin superfamily sugar epimerase